MKKAVIFFILIFFILKLVSSSSVGLSPMYFKEFFEPGLQKDFTFNTFNSDPNENLKIYAKGDLAEYVHINKETVKSDDEFHVHIKLPQRIERPGEHNIYIGVIESKDQSAGIGSLAAIEARISIFVPFPGVYLESAFDVKDINQGELVTYEINLNNLGTEGIKINPEIRIYEGNNTVSEIKLDQIDLSTKQSKSVTGVIDSKSFPAGNYKAVLSLTYADKKDKIEKEFRIGEFSVEILDYSYLFEKGKINPFTIEVESKWNTKINRVYAEATITDNGKIVGDFKTPFAELEPWETKNITGYFDTTSLEAKRHLANIKLYFDDGSSTKLVAIYIQNPPTKETTFYIIMGISFLIALIAITLLIIKNRKLYRNQNEKNK